jgi:hypothetical protein
MNKKNIIYFNGDSFTDDPLFREECYSQIDPSQNFIINNAMGGSWNPYIVKQTINELRYLDYLAKQNQTMVYACIIFTEVLRSPIELKILKKIKSQYNYEYLQDCLSELNKFYYTALMKNVSSLTNVKIHITTAFTDISWETDILPMYKIASKSNNHPICYNVSYLNIFGDTELINLGFNKLDLLELADSSLLRAKLLESLPNSKQLHIADREQYKLIVNSIQGVLL